MDRAQKPGPADIDVHVPGNIADGVDVFLFFEGKKESRAMEQTRGGHPPLLECLAVVAALALQFASVITLLQEHAAR